ncbi:flotillin family protein, partial [Rhizobium ruizarguesonis]
SAINLAPFIVLTAQSNYTVNLNASEQKLFSALSEMIAERDGFAPVVIRDADAMIGIVPIHDGTALPDGEIIAPTVAT